MVGQEEFFMRRQWTSDNRQAGTPDVSMPLVWGFLDSPVHTHMVSVKPGVSVKSG